jgi:hypothetical protein
MDIQSQGLAPTVTSKFNWTIPIVRHGYVMRTIILCCQVRVTLEGTAVEETYRHSPPLRRQQPARVRVLKFTIKTNINVYTCFELPIHTALHPYDCCASTVFNLRNCAIFGLEYVHCASLNRVSSVYAAAHFAQLRDVRRVRRGKHATRVHDNEPCMTYIFE